MMKIIKKLLDFKDSNFNFKRKHCKVVECKSYNLIGLKIKAANGGKVSSMA